MLICCRPTSSTGQPASGPSGSTSPLPPNSGVVVPEAAAPESIALPPEIQQESIPGLTHTLPTFVGNILKLNCSGLKVLTLAVGQGYATLSGPNQAQLLAFLSILMEGPFVAKSLLKHGPYGGPQPGQSGSASDYYAMVVEGTTISVWNRCTIHNDFRPHRGGRCPRCLGKDSAASDKKNKGQPSEDDNKKKKKKVQGKESETP
jgi:hypothetical protein